MYCSEIQDESSSVQGEGPSQDKKPSQGARPGRRDDEADHQSNVEYLSVRGAPSSQLRSSSPSLGVSSQSSDSEADDYYSS